MTAGLNGVLGAPIIAGAATARPDRGGKVDNASTVFLDVPGYNYRIEDIEAEHASHPERVVYASETFAKELFDYAALTERLPYFLGEFVWTAMDYVGEAGVGITAHLKAGAPPFYFASYPWVNAWCGDIDLIGDQKGASRARDVAWGLSPLEMSVQRPVPEGKYEFVAPWGWSDELQNWSWAGFEAELAGAAGDGEEQGRQQSPASSHHQHRARRDDAAQGRAPERRRGGLDQKVDRRRRRLAR